jgi:amino acid transporter
MGGVGWLLLAFYVVMLAARIAGVISRGFYLQLIMVATAANLMPPPHSIPAAIVWSLLMIVVGIIARMLTTRR